jgi:hypothetical protein
MRRIHAYLCRTWHPIAARAFLWVALGLTTGLSLGQIHHEGSVRERQLCGVVINVHHNAEFRADTEHQNLKSTMDYLADPRSKKDSRALYDRVLDNVPIVYNRVIVADGNVRATEPPPVCRKYATH